MPLCGLFAPRLSGECYLTTFTKSFNGSLFESNFIVFCNTHHSMVRPLDELLANIHRSGLKYSHLPHI